MKKKLQLFKSTISNLDNQAQKDVLGGAGTYYCSEVCSENPDCNTQGDCGVTWQQPYVCPSVNGDSCTCLSMCVTACCP